MVVAAEVRAPDRAIFQPGILKTPVGWQVAHGREKKEGAHEAADEFQCARRVTDRRCWRRNAEKRDFRRTLSSVTRRKTWPNVRRFL